MALNANHTFEDLDGQKCAIVEKNCSPERAGFLQKILVHNGYTVIVVNVPIAAPAAAAGVPAAGDVVPAVGEASASVVTPAAAPPPAKCTVGVTDTSFNPMNAIYNRELKTLDNKVLLPSDWMEEPRAVTKPGGGSWYWK